jgi:hypothetical protein
MAPKENSPSPRAHLLGVGLDNEDGHQRLTRAEKFTIVGGSEGTHEKMTETLLKTMESLKRRGRELEETDKEELADLLRKNCPD